MHIILQLLLEKMSSSLPCNKKLLTAKNVISILCGIIIFYLQTHTHTRTHVGCWNVVAPCDLTPACKVTNSIMSNSLYLNQACVCVCVFGCKIACLSSIWLCPKDRQDKVHPCTYPLTSLINKTRTHTHKCTHKLRFPCWAGWVADSLAGPASPHRGG